MFFKKKCDMKTRKLKDNLRFEDSSEGVVFNHYSFCELIKYIMIEYGKVTYKEADQKLNSSFLIKEPESMNDVGFFSHELEFHWAMLVLHGEMYWLRDIPSDFNNFKEEYIAWEQYIMNKYDLKEPYEYYDL